MWDPMHNSEVRHASIGLLEMVADRWPVRKKGCWRERDPACDSDHKPWAQVAHLEKKLGAAQGVNSTLHAELSAAQQQRQAEAVTRAQLQACLCFVSRSLPRPGDWDPRQPPSFRHRLS